MITIAGVLADLLGAASQVAVRHGGGRTFASEFSSVRSTEYRSMQATALAVDMNHGQRNGEVVVETID